MINRIYRLMDTKRIELVQRELAFDAGTVLVRPDYLSICAADQRYYFGRRHKEILNQKLPMALIHEATGTVLYDFTGKLEPGSPVVLLPLEPAVGPAAVKDNYRPESRFFSSGVDGFMQDVIAVSPERLIPAPPDYSAIYVFSELISVVINALDAFTACCKTPAGSFGVWGDGSMGYVTSLVLKCLYPGARVCVFGKTARKLQRFSFADQTIYIDAIPPELQVDHAFECVGGASSEAALEQMMQVVAPQACVSLLGVSEEPIAIPTRVILDKGLRLIGNNRSSAADFHRAVALIREHDLCRRYLEILISELIEVKNEADITYAFEQDYLNDFKTVIKWAI
jgi:ribitol-5-phosphate 2-dehydrogenase